MDEVQSARDRVAGEANGQRDHDREQPSAARRPRSSGATLRAARMDRVLALVYAVPGVGWVVATLAVLLYHRERGELPISPFGWRLLGGPYTALGTDRLTPLGWALAWLLIAVSSVDVLAGRWLWQGRPRGAVLALMMAPMSFALGWLFALPYLIVMAPLRAVGAIMAWRDLRPLTAPEGVAGGPVEGAA